MNEVITIENTEMQIREYNGQRVVTFKDIDEEYIKDQRGQQKETLQGIKSILSKMKITLL